MTSAAFGNWVKHRIGAAAVGHWGTLDPGASGVLGLAVGQATRLLPLISDARKRYVFELIVGKITDTGDSAGRIVTTATVPPQWAQGLSGLLPGMLGPLEQIPPMYSAVKVAGRRLHMSAREGKTVDRAPRRTFVHELRVLGVYASSARLVVECDAGTYVRTLCEEIGRRLGVPAHMGALLRTAAGPFELASAKLPAEIAADPASCLIDPLSVLGQVRVVLQSADCRRFMHGNQVRLFDVAPDDEEVVVVHAEAPIGTGRLISRGGELWLLPSRVLARGSQGGVREGANG
ncbi:MAG: tRNA pseudouridine(55) synthase TruB [Candidatus Eremiobacteraeota bacterium]|nr:tRNA pseudouridine(55) synthase TruB [Candidatus Eremiobacteraeota bacterium]